VAIAQASLPYFRSLGMAVQETDWLARVWFPETGVAVPSVKNVVNGMGFDNQAVNELAAYILMNGECYGRYGNEKWSYPLVHALLCGVDWDKSTGPENETWSEFNGTFSDSTQASMTSIKLACQCGYTGRNGCEVGVEALSIADLLALVSGSFRDKM
jgi:hypothetical protein